MKPKRVAIVQSNYLPWKGYFDLIHSVDEFILFDDAQFTKRDWRNRNQIKTPQGLLWLTVPVVTKGKQLQKIKDTVVSEHTWAEKHWTTLRHHYAKAPRFEQGAAILEPLLRKAGSLERLSDVNELLLRGICDALGIATKLSCSMHYHPLSEGKNERLIGLCLAAGAGHYVSGPAAKDYLDEALFRKAGIEVSFMDYTGYPEYAQLGSPFVHTVSIADLLLNQGSDAPKYMKSFRSPVADVAA